MKFLQKPEIEQRTRSFIENFISYNTQKNSQVSDIYCTYEIVTTNQENRKESILQVYSNSKETADTLYKYIIENVRVNYKVTITSNYMIDLIKRRN